MIGEVGLSSREACGNTVRNVTASPEAGVDPQEPFDVSPFADATFRYFLRNPICQDMGRKFKISFSSSDFQTFTNCSADMPCAIAAPFTAPMEVPTMICGSQALS